MYLLKGLIIGIIAAVPVGPLGMLAIRKTIHRGWKDGLVSAFGTIASDAVYSTIAVLGLSIVDEFIGLHRPVIIMLSGILFCALGIRFLFMKREDPNPCESSGNEKLNSFASHFIMGLSNPMTCMVFFVLFAKMSVDIDGWSYRENALFVLSIFSGSSLLWMVITNLIEKSKSLYSTRYLLLMDKVLGTALLLIGLFSILRG
jgi:threonine/homoserine/homoserine lactone efflux protein